MIGKDAKALRDASPYNAAITREQFLFYEMQTTAKLVCEGLSKDEVAEKIVEDNLFRYPTEKSVRKMALACLRRLDAMGDEKLVQAIVMQPSDVAKQICLYAMMRQYRLVWDFMLTVVGEKYRKLDTSFSKIDVDEFFDALKEKDGWVACWSETTIKKLKEVLRKVLVENDYLEDVNATELRPVSLNDVLKKEIIMRNEMRVLVAFNYFNIEETA